MMQSRYTLLTLVVCGFNPYIRILPDNIKLISKFRKIAFSIEMGEKSLF